MATNLRSTDDLSTEDLLEIAAGVVEDVQVRDLDLPASARPHQVTAR